MIRKVIFGIFSLFLICSGNCSAVEIIPIQNEDKNAFQMTLDFLEDHPEYNMVIESDNHLFRGADNNKILACKYMSDGSTLMYNAYYDVGYTLQEKNRSKYFYHIFERGQERQSWRFLEDNLMFLR